MLTSLLSRENINFLGGFPFLNYILCNPNDSLLMLLRDYNVEITPG